MYCIHSHLKCVEIGRWKARCNLALFELEEAKSCLDKAEEKESNSLCTYYLRFLIALETAEDEGWIITILPSIFF